ncbi:hypothetical protein [Aeromonas enteropelogenes]|uniref:hypothetical protein n=1 Tax=Aeromonas enteropelogenes TaxID=29489 RepID=UPI0038D13485
MKVVIISIPFILIYIFSMIIAPWFIYSFSWKDVHQVWLDWQTLNTGVLALISSLIAFYSVKHQQLRSEEKEFQAAKALLPDSLSELCDYTEKAGEVLKYALEMISQDLHRNCNGLGIDIPSKPTSHINIISTIIKNSDDKYAESFTIFIQKMQVFHARLCNLNNSFSSDSRTVILDINILSDLILLAELHAFISHYFDFARDNNFDEISSFISRERIDGSLLALGVFVENYPKLKPMLDRRKPK